MRRSKRSDQNEGSQSEGAPELHDMDSVNGRYIVKASHRQCATGRCFTGSAVAIDGPEVLPRNYLATGAAGGCSFDMSTTQRHCPSASKRQIDIPLR